MVRITLTENERFAVHEDRIIVLVSDKQEKTSSGIILPEDSENKNQIGIIKGIGEDVKTYKSGDTIVFNKFAGNEIIINDTEFMIMKEMDVMGSVETK